MSQKMSIAIGGKKYTLTADSPEQENAYRAAAYSVNKMLSVYTAKFPGKDMDEILSFVALNEGIGAIMMKKKLEAVEKELQTLKNQIDTYLDNIDNQPPAEIR
ncbi:MAG: cell division protein ZapA [Candidatus Cryptobacteroides sp.]|nr:cell division protein ZapA [Bacteroidales bacterium]